jgi:hypothetical protein
MAVPQQTFNVRGRKKTERIFLKLDSIMPAAVAYTHCTMHRWQWAVGAPWLGHAGRSAATGTGRHMKRYATWFCTSSLKPVYCSLKSQGSLNLH